eukprot:403372033
MDKQLKTRQAPTLGKGSKQSIGSGLRSGQVSTKDTTPNTNKNIIGGSSFDKQQAIPSFNKRNTNSTHLTETPGTAERSGQQRSVSRQNTTSRRDSINITRNSALGGLSAKNNARSASTDIFHRPNQANNFWQSMQNFQRFNNWNQNYTSEEQARSRDRSAPSGMLVNFGSSSQRETSSNRGGFGSSAARFGAGTVNNGKRSTTNSVSRGRANNENDFGVWGKKSTQEYYQNRDSSPAFGGARVRAIKEDCETTSNYSGSSSHRGNNNFKSTAAALTKKSQAKYTYSQIQMGADESNVTNQFTSDKVADRYKEKKSELIMEQSKQNRVIQGEKGTQNKIKQDKEVNSKINGKVNARLRYFTSQISNIPGPNDVGNSTMAEDLGKERRDGMVYSDPKFRLRHEYYLSSTYQGSKYKSDYEPGKEYESYKKDVKDIPVNRKTTQQAAAQRQRFYHTKTQIY